LYIDVCRATRHLPSFPTLRSSDLGTIAYKANGKIPIYENSEDALLPLPGWEAKYEWKGYIPFSELPKVVNPEKGYIATANNKVRSEEHTSELQSRENLVCRLLLEK